MNFKIEKISKIEVCIGRVNNLCEKFMHFTNIGSAADFLRNNARCIPFKSWDVGKTIVKYFNEWDGVRHRHKQERIIITKFG